MECGGYHEWRILEKGTPEDNLADVEGFGVTLLVPHAWAYHPHIRPAIKVDTQFGEVLSPFAN